MRLNAKEMGRLAQGFKDVKGSNTIFFIPRNKIPKNKKPVYMKINCNYRLEKQDPYRIRITVGGNQIIFKEDKSSPTCDIVTIKMHWNSVNSTPNAKYATLDVKDFYLQNDLEEYEYMFFYA